MINFSDKTHKAEWRCQWHDTS